MCNASLVIFSQSPLITCHSLTLPLLLRISLSLHIIFLSFLCLFLSLYQTLILSPSLPLNLSISLLLTVYLSTFSSLLFYKIFIKVRYFCVKINVIVFNINNQHLHLNRLQLKSLIIEKSL